METSIISNCTVAHYYWYFFLCKIFKGSYSNSVILRDAWIIDITCAVSPNNGIFCKVLGHSTDNLQKWENSTILSIMRFIHYFNIIFSFIILPEMSFVQFQRVQTLYLECGFDWNCLKRLQWVADHLCHLKAGAEDSLDNHPLFLHTHAHTVFVDLWSDDCIFFKNGFCFHSSYQSQIYTWMPQLTGL